MSVVDDIKDKLDVATVIGQYVNLKKTGRNFKGLCPFHAEKTPSFIVSPERQSWHCFGCGVGGDIFSFIMKKDGLDFGAALHVLAEKAGVTLASGYGDFSADKEYERLYDVNEAAAQYYHHILTATAAGKSAFEYLEGRGVNRQTIDDFQLGYSMDSWDGLQKYLTGRSLSDMADAGLLVKKEKGFYDMFRGRIMFPIRSKRGKVLGFGGRIFNKDGPKYINSPQTKIFNKSNIIYGIDRSAGAIRQMEMAVIVEGYMDVLTAHQYGMNNVVAFMGTAITESQIEALSRLTGNIVLALDADAAGNEAALRGIEVCRRTLHHKKGMSSSGSLENRPTQMDIRIVTLPKGKDPDEIIRQDAALWRRAVDQSLPVIDYLFKVIAAKYDLKSTKERTAAAYRLIPIIKDENDTIRRDIYIRNASQLLGISEDTFREMVAGSNYATGKAAAKQSQTISKGDPLEEHCLCLLLQNKNLHDKCGDLLERYFNRPDNRHIYEVWRDDPNTVEEKIAVGLQDHLIYLNSKLLPPADDNIREKELAGCIRRLRDRYNKRQQAEVCERYDEGYIDPDEASRQITRLTGD